METGDVLDIFVCLRGGDIRSEEDDKLSPNFIFGRRAVVLLPDMFEGLTKESVTLNGISSNLFPCPWEREYLGYRNSFKTRRRFSQTYSSNIPEGKSVWTSLSLIDSGPIGEDEVNFSTILLMGSVVDDLIGLGVCLLPFPSSSCFRM